MSPLDTFQPASAASLRTPELSAETKQRIEALEGDVEKIESQLAQHVAGLGQARHALSVNLEQVQSTIPKDGALVEYLGASRKGNLRTLGTAEPGSGRKPPLATRLSECQR